MMSYPIKTIGRLFVFPVYCWRSSAFYLFDIMRIL
jgi:hypothetical protein